MIKTVESATLFHNKIFHTFLFSGQSPDCPQPFLLHMIFPEHGFNLSGSCIPNMIDYNENKSHSIDRHSGQMLFRDRFRQTG